MDKPMLAATCNSTTIPAKQSLENHQARQNVRHNSDALGPRARGIIVNKMPFSSESPVSSW